MIIDIRISGGRNIRIPLPMWVLKIGSSETVINFIKKHMKEEDARYLNYIDFDLFKYNLELLKEYKGLTIVDVQSKDGTGVKIRV
jgi:hypothetical protein